MNQRTIKASQSRFLKIPKIPKLPWRGFLAGSFLLFFLAGILAANWVGREKLMQYGILNDYYVGQLAYTDLDTGAYFRYLCMHRCRAFAMTMLFVHTRFSVLALLGAVGWYAFSLGYLFVNALVCMGFQGMILVLLSVFPQIICYAAAYFGLAKKVFGKYAETAMPIGMRRFWKNPQLYLTLSAVLCMLAGIWLEGYVNPLLLKAYIRRM